MMTYKERRKRIDAKLKEELAAGKEIYLWMSFCDPKKPKGKQFLGVIITKAMGLTHAMRKTHKLGINPGGEIKAFEIPPNKIKSEHLDCLMSKDDLQREGLI